MGASSRAIRCACVRLLLRKVRVRSRPSISPRIPPRRPADGATREQIEAARATSHDTHSAIAALLTTVAIVAPPLADVAR